MKLRSLFGVLTFSATVSAASAEDYLWTISHRDDDPFANTGVPTSEIRDLYLWLACAAGDGMTCAEFDVVGDGVPILAVQAATGFVVVAPPPDLLLCTFECTWPPALAARVLVLDLPGTVCIVPSDATGTNATVDCDVNPAAHPNAVIGYASDGTDPCRIGTCLPPFTVDDSSWGSVKGLYR